MVAEHTPEGYADWQDDLANVRAEQQSPEDPDAATERALDAQRAYADEVAREAHRLRVREAAREKVAAEKAGEAPPFDAGTLVDVLARPAEPAHRVDGLIPTGASTLLVAERKTGKTTLSLNLARTLLVGGDFLGRFLTEPAGGNVAILNYEVTGAMLAGWAHEVGVPADRLLLVNLRGRRNPLRYPDDREALARLLAEHRTESLLVDPFSRAYWGQSQNDAAEVEGWLTDLDRFARAEVGARDLILTAHAGWGGERARGSSALEGWPDVTLTMTRGREDQRDRYLAAEGRGVHVDEDRLDFDPDTLTLTLAGSGSRSQDRARQRREELVQAVVAVVIDKPGLKTGELEDALREGGHGFQRGDVGAAARQAMEVGRIRTEKGPRNAVLHYPETSNLPSAPESSPWEVVSAPDRPPGGGSTTGLLSGSVLPDDGEHGSDSARAAGPTRTTCRTCGSDGGKAGLGASGYCSSCEGVA